MGGWITRIKMEVLVRTFDNAAADGLGKQETNGFLDFDLKMIRKGARRLHVNGEAVVLLLEVEVETARRERNPVNQRGDVGLLEIMQAHFQGVAPLTAFTIRDSRVDNRVGISG